MNQFLTVLGLSVLVTMMAAGCGQQTAADNSKTLESSAPELAGDGAAEVSTSQDAAFAGGATGASAGGATGAFAGGAEPPSDSSAAALTDGHAVSSGWQRRQIGEQTFDVELDGWGAVTFASYLPEDTEDNDGDACFKLLKDGKAVYDFPGITSDNRRAFQQFVQAAAVAFRDYDADGRTDIILILEYSAYGDPDSRFREIRLYTQPEGDTPPAGEFLLDPGPAHYLVNHHYGGSIRSVMEGIAEYRTHKDAMARPNGGGADAQLRIFADNRDLWAAPAEYGSEYSYTVTDLDQNGRLELVSSVIQGTGFYSTSTFYEINESFDGLSIFTSHFEGDSEADMITDTTPVFYDASRHWYHYIFDDYIKASILERYENKRALTFTDGSVLETALAYCSYYWPADDLDSDPVFTYTDADGNAITEEEYIHIEESVFSGLESMTADFSWFRAYDCGQDGDFSKPDRESLLSALRASYGGFVIGREIRD